MHTSDLDHGRCSHTFLRCHLSSAQCGDNVQESVITALCRRSAVPFTKLFSFVPSYVVIATRFTFGHMQPFAIRQSEGFSYIAFTQSAHPNTPSDATEQLQKPFYFICFDLFFLSYSVFRFESFCSGATNLLARCSLHQLTRWKKEERK